MSKLSRKEARVRRHRRLRRKITGSADTPRMSVCCTGRHIYVQFVDDTQGRTLASVSTLDAELGTDKARSTVAGAAKLGKLAAERAAKVNISRVVFDRGGFRYHGRVKAIAEAAREAGLQF
jgi:large subunit ribosomal protein L18